MAMYTPQQILDQLHEINLAGAITPDMPERDVLIAIKLGKQKLRAVKQRLHAEQTYIKGKWNGRIAHEAEARRLELLPYDLLDDLISQLEVYLVSQDTAVKLHQQFDDMPRFGMYIIGTVTEGYRIVDAATAQAWIDEKQAIIEQKKAAQEEAVRQQQIARDAAIQRMQAVREKAARDQEIAVRQEKIAMRTARDLIQAKRYDDARAILTPLVNPLAVEWLIKIDKLDKPKSRSGLLSLVLVVLIVGALAAFGLWSANSAQSNAPSALNIPTASPTWTPEYFTEVPSSQQQPTATIQATSTRVPGTDLPFLSETRQPTYVIEPLIPLAPTVSYGGYSGGSTCADGTHSSSTGRGTCSHHGGISR
jgi:hypothetical protein